LRVRVAAKGLGSAATAFAALGDPTRLGIVVQLGTGGPLSTMELTAETNVSRQAIAKHLRALEHAGIVRGERVGRDRIWELQTTRFAELRGYLDEISAQWGDALARLRMLVEGKG
jgi:DNA-binding transcriptional ArsR family regulator